MLESERAWLRTAARSALLRTLVSLRPASVSVVSLMLTVTAAPPFCDTVNETLSLALAKSTAAASTVAAVPLSEV